MGERRPWMWILFWMGGRWPGRRNTRKQAPTCSCSPAASPSNELGPASVDGWLARLAARDVLADAAAALAADERRLRLDGQVIALSPLEFGVLCCLHERED